MLFEMQNFLNNYIFIAFATVLGFTIYVFLWNKKQLKDLKNLPSLKGVFPVGHLNYFKKFNVKKDVPKMAYVLEVSTGLGKLFEKEGKFLLRLGLQNLAVLATAEYAQMILTNKKELRKSDSYHLAKRLVGNSTLTNEGDAYGKRHRKIINQTFHSKMLNQFQDNMVKHSSILARKLSKFEKRNEVNIKEYLTKCTLDIITEIVLGENQENNYFFSKEILESLEIIEKTWSESIVRIWMQCDIMFDLTPTGKEFFVQKSKVFENFQKKIKERKSLLETFEKTKLAADNFDPTCLLDFLIKEQLRDPTSFSDMEIYEEAFTIMEAGIQTTAISAAWILFVIGNYQKEQLKIHEELDSIFGVNTDTHIDAKDLSQLKYLECVIKEVLRMYPPFPFISRKLKEDLYIDDLKLPKGTTTVLAVLMIHRNPEYYDEPEKFIPERFQAECIRERHPYSYIPFSSGPRNCMGRAFAMRSIMTMLATLLRCYKIESVDNIDRIGIDWQIMGRPHKDILIRIHKR